MPSPAPVNRRSLLTVIGGSTARALADPWLQARYGELGTTPMPTTPAEIKAFRDSEEVRLLPIMKAAGIKPE